MASDLKRGDHVEWNSEAGRVRGTIQKKVTKEITFKGYKRHASREEPQYVIKSDKTDHLAIHKGSALNRRTPDRSPVSAVARARLRSLFHFLWSNTTSSQVNMEPVRFHNAEQLAPTLCDPKRRLKR